LGRGVKKWETTVKDDEVGGTVRKPNRNKTPEKEYFNKIDEKFEKKKEFGQKREHDPKGGGGLWEKVSYSFWVRVSGGWGLANWEVKFWGPRRARLA